MKPKIKTFHLSGGVYKGGAKLSEALSHACEVDAKGFPTRVLCGKVKLENVCEDPLSSTDETPTCGTCAKRKAKEVA
jgi:hypothetical protein